MDEPSYDKHLKVGDSSYLQLLKVGDRQFIFTAVLACAEVSTPMIIKPGPIVDFSAGQ